MEQHKLKFRYRLAKSIGDIVEMLVTGSVELGDARMQQRVMRLARTLARVSYFLDGTPWSYSYWAEGEADEAMKAAQADIALAA